MNELRLLARQSCVYCGGHGHRDRSCDTKSKLQNLGANNRIWQQLISNAYNQTFIPHRYLDEVPWSTVKVGKQQVVKPPAKRTVKKRKRDIKSEEHTHEFNIMDWYPFTKKKKSVDSEEVKDVSSQDP